MNVYSTFQENINFKSENGFQKISFDFPVRQSLTRSLYSGRSVAVNAKNIVESGSGSQLFDPLTRAENLVSENIYHCCAATGGYKVSSPVRPCFFTGFLDFLNQIM